MKRLLVCFSVVLTIFKSGAQENVGQPPKIIQNSPEVSALQRYGDIPVSIYTGVPDISVPLYTVKSGDLQLPISVSYHASGIRVADEASRVGLGWVLNANGVIGRTVMGKDDLADIGDSKHWNNSNYGGIPDAPASPNVNSIVPLIQQLVSDQGNTVDEIQTFGGTIDGSRLLENYDFQPDQYTYNFPKGAGKFITKRNRDVILSNQQKLSIKCGDNNGTSWEIKTPDGSTYIFAQVENYKNPGDEVLIKSAWYLTKIISVTGNEINFAYQVVTNNYTKSVGTYFECHDVNHWVAYQDVQGAPFNIAVNAFNGAIQGREYTTVYLDKITFKNGELKFVYGTRDDVINDVKLEKMQLYKKDAISSSQTLFKEWLLSYDYFVGTYDHRFLGGTFDQDTKRLKLTSITEKDAAGNSIPPYQFTYVGASDMPGGFLPAKTTFARDHWGYFNGKTNNASLIPTYTYNYSGNIAASLMGLMGTERNTDAAYAKLFMLKQINYPTGGKTVFDYESNEFNVANSQVSGDYYEALYPETREVIFSKTYDGRITGPNPTDFTNPGDKLFDLTDMYVDENPFTSVHTSKVSVEARFLLRDAKEPTEMNSLFNNKVTFSFRSIDGLTNTGPENLFSNISETESNTAPATYYYSHTPDGYRWIYVKREYNVVPGKYTWQLYLDGIATGTDYFFSDVLLNVTYNAVTTKDPDNVTISDNSTTIYGSDFAGGQRIKRIRSYTNDNDTKPNITRYVYRVLGADNKWRSTGKRLSRPIYSYFERTRGDYVIDPEEGQVISNYWQHLMRQSDSNIPLNAAVNGTIVGYDKVTVLNGENGENGKTEYAFDNTPDKIFEYVETDAIHRSVVILPRKPPVSSTTSSESNGNLLHKADYKNQNGSFLKLHEIINEYSNRFQGLPLYWGIEVRPLFGYFISGEFPTPVPTNIFMYPAMYATRNLLTSSEVRNYDQNDQTRFISEKTDYSYDQSNHLQLTSTTTTRSNGDQLTTTYKYAADFTPVQATPIIADMAGEKFMHAVPVSKGTSIVKAGSNVTAVLGSNIFTFKNENAHIVPAEVRKLEKANPMASISGSWIPATSTYPEGYNLKLQFEKYDAEGNLQQMRKTDDVPVSYIWDYKNAYPIAEITNATFDDIACTSFESDGKGNWTFNGTITTASVAPFPPTGTRFYNLSSGNDITKTITSGKAYTISYWRLNSTSPFSITGGTGNVTQGTTINNWTYFEHKIIANSATITISGTGGMDELRLYPVMARVTSYTYEPLVGMTSQCDANNKMLYYQYDGFGRLTLIRDQDNNILKTFDYKYQQNTD
jgi:hypothetical protein